jgi:hypothetical protein
MELTYDNMKKMLQDYFDELPSIEGPQDEARILKYFSPDFKIRWGSPSIEQNREEWVAHLCGHANDYRAVVHYKPEPLGIMIDEKRKMATMIITEEFLRPVTNEPIMNKEFICVLWELCIHDNKVKAKKEMILVISGYLE